MGNKVFIASGQRLYLFDGIPLKLKALYGVNNEGLLSQYLVVMTVCCCDGESSILVNLTTVS